MDSKTWPQARKILAIRLDALGDVLMTTPALRALRQGGRQITLLTSLAGAAVAPFIPSVDRVIRYEAPWMKATPPRSGAAQDQEMIAFLRAAGFDAAVIFTVFSQNPLPAAWLAYLAEIPLRLAHCRENPYQLLTDWAPEQDFDGQPVRHEVRRQLDLVARVGFRTEDERLDLAAPSGSRRRARRRLQALGVDLDRPWVVIHPGASAPSRRYPPERFAAVAQTLAAVHGWQVVFTGGTGEMELVENIRRQACSGEAATFSVASRLSLGELCGLLAEAPLMIANNTGPVHMAAGLGTPVVDLYALTNPQHTPWMVPNRVLNHDVPCKHCYKSICPLGHQACLSELPPEEVVQAALDLWQETAPARRELAVAL